MDNLKIYEYKKYFNLKKIVHTLIYYLQSWITFQIFIFNKNIKTDFIKINKVSTSNINRNEVVNLNYLKKCVNNLSIVDTKKYNFIDLGSGSGIALTYIHFNFSFNNLIGYEIYKNNYIHTLEKLTKFNIKVFNLDVAKLILKKNPTILYIFNSFGSETLNIFISNNLKMLKETKSKLIYINAKHLDIINKYHVNSRKLDFGIYPIYIIDF